MCQKYAAERVDSSPEHQQRPKDYSLIKKNRVRVLQNFFQPPFLTKQDCTVPTFGANAFKVFGIIWKRVMLNQIFYFLSAVFVQQNAYQVYIFLYTSAIQTFRYFVQNVVRRRTCFY